MTTKEIVTLQIGHFSNFIGTHWWNIQESSFVYDPSQATEKEFNHDILFREGKNHWGDVTYTPRLVAIDLKGSLDTLKQEGTLYDEHKQHGDEVKWTGDVTLHQSSSLPKNTYLSDLEKEEQQLLKGKDENQDEHCHRSSVDEAEVKDHLKTGVKGMHELQDSSTQVFGKRVYNLDDSVSVWSDYLRVHLHPKSIQLIQKFRHKDELHPFDIYGCGQEVMSEYEVRTEIEDRLHFFIEECDQLQGFHVLLDTFDGFGGIGSHVLHYLQDEFNTKGILTIGATPNDLVDNTPQSRASRILNSALSYTKCWNNSSLFVPVSLNTQLWRALGPSVDLPYLDFKGMHYHTSSILAATLDTMTAPYRSTNPIHIRDITDSFNILGRKVAAVNSSLPFPIGCDEDILDYFLSLDNEVPWVPLTPHVKIGAKPYMQSAVLRGISSLHLKRKTDVRSKYFEKGCASQSVNDVVQQYLTEEFPSCRNAGSVFKMPLKLTAPYPHIFRKCIDQDGFISLTERHNHQAVESAPIMTSLQSTPEISSLTESLHSEASRLNIKKHHRFLEAGLEEDDYAEILSDINTLNHCYTTPADMG